MAKADVIGLQEIPRSAFDLLKQELKGFDGKHTAKVDKEDGAAVFWRASVFSLTHKDVLGNPLSEKAYDGSAYDTKTAVVLFLTYKNDPNIVVGVASAHFGDSFYAKTPEDAGVLKMTDIIKHLDNAKTSINMIFGPGLKG